MERHFSYQNSGSSEPTNQVPQEKIQQGLGNQQQKQEIIMSNWQPGHRLKDGRYIIQRKLTWGGFADIYIAKNEDNQDVAIKILKSELQAADDFDSIEENFVKEAMNLRSCQHPHIVKFKDIIKTSEGWCMVMEYIEGEDLKSWVDKNGPLSEIDALRYIKQIGKALIEVHNHNLLHRDVKPRNIIRRANGLEAVLIDFGISRKFSSNKIEHHTPFLTEDFAPIEQYQEKYPRGACTDVYALAATLYFLLTGKTPIASWRRLDASPLETPLQINKGKHISEKVNNAILLGMQIYPQERPETVQKWLDMLSLTLDEEKGTHTTEKEFSSIAQQNNNSGEIETTQPTKTSIQVNRSELSSWLAAFTSSTSFLMALAIFSSLGTTLISAGFWLVLVIVVISVSLFITKRRNIKQLIRLFISSIIPTLVILIYLKRIVWTPQELIWIVLLLTVISGLLGFAVMSLYPQITQLFYDLDR